MNNIGPKKIETFLAEMIERQNFVGGYKFTLK